jgi:DNA-directed RNA polymerase subunit M/transcription elongation factor TFIIS
MLFCPRCSNLLLLGQNGQEMRFVCQTCPYYHAITQKMFKTMALDRKEVAEVESEKDWTNEDSDGAESGLQCTSNFVLSSYASVVLRTDPFFASPSPLPKLQKERSLVLRTTDTLSRRA